LEHFRDNLDKLYESILFKKKVWTIVSTALRELTGPATLEIDLIGAKKKKKHSSSLTAQLPVADQHFARQPATSILGQSTNPQGRWNFRMRQSSGMFPIPSVSA
jgi:hypothetical protein